jgi:hypothetical protein
MNNFYGWLVRPFIAEPRHRRSHSAERIEGCHPEFDFGQSPSYQELQQEPSVMPRIVHIVFPLLLIAILAVFGLVVVMLAVFGL